MTHTNSKEIIPCALDPSRVCVPGCLNYGVQKENVKYALRVANSIISTDDPLTGEGLVENHRTRTPLERSIFSTETLHNMPHVMCLYRNDIEESSGQYGEG